MTVEKAARAGAWSALDVLMRQAVNFVVLMIMARLLTPADFGIVALVSFFAGISIVFVQGGLSQALIQRQQTTREEESAVFWWNLGGSALFAGFLILISPWVAAFYGYPIIQPLMIVAAAQIMFAALGAVQTALLTRALRFDRLTISGAVASVCSGAIGIGAALAGWGLWALAFQLASLALISSLVLWFVCDWRPVLHFRFSTIRSMFGFGIYLSLSSALDVLYTQGFALIIGKLHGVSDLGLYNRAHSTQALPSNILSSMVARTAFPLFSTRSEDDAALRRGVRMANSLAMIVNLPAMLGLAMLSDLVIVSLFGPQWRGSAPLLAILAIGGILLPLHVINLQVLLARAQSRRFFQLELIKKAVGLAFVLVGSIFGVTGLAWSMVLFGFVALPINASPVKEAIGYGPAAQLWDLRGLLLPAAAMCAAVLSLRPVLAFPEPVSLALLAAAGAAVYGLAGLVLRSANFGEAQAIAFSLVRRRTGRAD
jgi:O-antigen/teichoic acid export membrane protein